MSAPQAEGWSRRQFLGGLTLAVPIGLRGLRPWLVSTEPAPETATLRLDQWPALCFAPHYMAAELLQAEGFTDVQYVKTETAVAQQHALASGAIHFSLYPAGLFASRWEAGDPLVLLAGLHAGCYELFATHQVRTIRSLRGKTVSVSALGSGRHREPGLHPVSPGPGGVEGSGGFAI
jgi:NitT/TauT family transport system substrate-binding protein